MKLMLPLIIVFFSLAAIAQDSLLKKIPDPDKYLSDVNKTAVSIDNDLERNTDKLLKKLYILQSRMQKKLQNKDSVAASVLARLPATSNAYIQSVKSQLPAGLYGNTQQTALNFLKSNNSLIGNASSQLAKVSQNYDAMTSKLHEAEQLKQFAEQREQELIEQLGKYTSCVRQLKAFKQEVNSYSSAVQSYKDILSNPSKAEAKALEILNQTPAFHDFMSKHSYLGMLFPQPDNYGTPAALAGLQSRQQVQQLISGQVAAGGPGAADMISQRLQDAKTKLSNLKSAAENSPAHNTQHTKSFSQRLEYGATMQTARSTNYFPSTSDIGLYTGYRLNDKSVIGVGLSYKLGWGKDIGHIHLSSQGIGLRSFFDCKIKGSYWASGGAEMNHNSAFNNFNDLRVPGIWNKSALIGISKEYSVSKIVKGKIQLLYDLLWKEQTPRGQQFQFRIGYSLK
jgi:hypothetical protein